MRVNRIVEKTFAEGPGCRFCIWVQGCNHKCKGCFSQHTWDINGGTELSVSSIIENINKVRDQIDGITFLGGEPFLQATELALIGEFAQSIGKNVITFSGYTYSELLEASLPDAKKLLAVTDLLIDGRFEEARKDFSRPLAGSSNQEFVYITNKITPDEMMNYKNRFEIRVEENGNISVNGMGDVDKLKEKLQKEIYF